MNTQEERSTATGSGVGEVWSSDGRVRADLAALRPGTLLDERGLAAALEVSPRTLRRMVQRKELPVGVRLGAQRVWLVENVLAFLAERAEHARRQWEGT